MATSCWNKMMKEPPVHFAHRGAPKADKRKISKLEQGRKKAFTKHKRARKASGPAADD